MKLIKKIVELIFGRKYFVNIIHTRGTDKIEATSIIHRTMKSAMEHRQRIEATASFSYVETISFRSRYDY